MYHKKCEYTSKVQFFLFVYKNKHPYGCNSPCRLEKFQGHALFFFFSLLCQSLRGIRSI